MMETMDNDKIMKRVKISFVMLMSIMIMLSYVPALANSPDHFPGNVFYVSTNGSDSNPGSIEAPWRTIQYAAEQLKAGETVLVRGGVYEESITITSSGSASAGYITFQAYPGEQPIINASKINSSTIVHFTDANYIIFDGFELTGLYADSSSKYLAAIKVTNSGSNLHILNNYIHHIANVHAKGNANGIIVYGNGIKAISDITIAGNTLHNLTLGSSESLTVVGNVDGFTVANNLIYDVNNIGIDIAGHYNTCSSPCNDQARNGVVADNKVYNVDTITNPAYRGVRAAAAIYVDGGTNTIIERNEVFNNNYGIEIASEKRGEKTANIIVRNNFIYNNHQSGLIMGGSSSGNGAATNNVIINNTFYNNNVLRTGDGEITFQKYVQNNSFFNNIFYTNSETPFFYDNNSGNTGNTIDYNMYYVNGSLSSHWRLNGTKFSSLEAYVAKSKQDAHSVYADPLFVDVKQGNIALQSTSPAIDRGTAASRNEGEWDLWSQIRTSGKSIDMGAVEYSGQVVGTPAPVTPIPTIEPTPVPTEPAQTPPPTPIPSDGIDPNESDITINIDGVIDDWKAVNELTNSSSNVKSMKAFIANETLYILVTGNLLSEKGQVYIDTGSQADQAFAVPHWSGHKAAYLLENGTLYEYSGDGKSWSWRKVSAFKKENAAITTSAVEIAVPLSILKTKSIDIGYIWKDSTSNKLPLGGGMVSVPELTKEPIETPTPTATLAPIETPTPTVTPTMTPTPTLAPTPTVTPIPSPDNGIIIDGKVADWSAIQAAATSKGNVKSVKITNDTQNLYVLVEGTKLNGKDQIYINSDNDTKTGYFYSKWTTSGIDYLVEDGKIYLYVGDGKRWSFKQKVNLSQNNGYYESSSVLEFAIPLQELEISSEQTIMLGVLIDDNSSKKLPASGEMISYSLQ